MHMRIIAGDARGKVIEAPEGMDTRPVTDKIRQALFNIWQFDIRDTSFLDLFSGSGSMGLEALSRKADRVVMAEKSRKAADVIRRNLKACRFENRNVRVLEEDVFQAIADLKKRHETFDRIYLDPPYTVESIFDPVMEALGDGELLNPDGEIVIRSLNTKPMKERYGKLRKYREKTWGISTAHFYKIQQEEDTEKDN
ncbi:16S rRNA (guanine(966)-N(2))-methyltransferase RsmD [Allobaculum mucilyticum]|uniref:16S rRNA (guanine(966)-N(2))-methyltransferase RsmD n=1 Tax=Allobaculum mucilyticum TaxID=2834459 RepID=UPI00227ECA97|nr:16S rRNA (guanine(966)-N(2))-methyltransferase RsmD [Allobaculum mucilyticum]